MDNKPINEADTKELLKIEVGEMLALEEQLAANEAQLMQIEQFRTFLQLQRDVQTKLAEFWKRVEERMIAENIKGIKGDWGSLTIQERNNWRTTDELPAKFYKKVVDTKKLTDTYHLEGKVPKGAEHYITKSLTKRLKDK
jgi:hypothetical protein